MAGVRPEAGSVAGTIPADATPAGVTSGRPTSIVERYDAIVCDIDGVLARGLRPVEGAPQTLRRLRELGIPLRLLTNNASRTPAEVARWLDGLGFDIAAADVLTSSVAVAALLDPGTRCLVVGTCGLREPLSERGCVLVDDPEDAQAVVVGIDLDLTYDKLRRAASALHRGARFLATNTDRTFPTEDGLWPGNGAVIAFLEAASDRTPEVAGKPHLPLFDAAAAQLGAPQRLLMVGDRLETDILGAQNAGWDTAVVLTGVSRREDVERHLPAPTYVLDDISGLLA